MVLNHEFCCQGCYGLTDNMSPFITGEIQQKSKPGNVVLEDEASCYQIREISYEIYFFSYDQMVCSSDDMHSLRMVDERDDKIYEISCPLLKGPQSSN